LEIKISNKAEQPLLSRTELQGVVSFESATPSRIEIKKKIADALKSDASLITIISIKNYFGQKAARVTAHIYETKEDLEKYISKKVKNRNSPRKEKKEEAEKPADAAAPAKKEGQVKEKKEAAK